MPDILYRDRDKTARRIQPLRCRRYKYGCFNFTLMFRPKDASRDEDVAKGEWMLFLRLQFPSPLAGLMSDGSRKWCCRDTEARMTFELLIPRELAMPSALPNPKYIHRQWRALPVMNTLYTLISAPSLHNYNQTFSIFWHGIRTF